MCNPTDPNEFIVEALAVGTGSRYSPPACLKRQRLGLSEYNIWGSALCGCSATSSGQSTRVQDVIGFSVMELGEAESQSAIDGSSHGITMRRNSCHVADASTIHSGTHELMC